MATTQNPSQSTSGPANDIVDRIECALEAARGVVSQFVSGRVKTSDRTLVTEADRSVNRMLREVLLRDQEGWLSEEDVDNLERLQAHRVWIVVCTSHYENSGPAYV